MNLSEVNWDFESAGTWPLPVKALTVVFLCALVIGLWIHFDTMTQLDALEQEEKKEHQLKEQFESKQRKAANLEVYLRQMEEMEESFGEMLRQLPDRTEVAKLLVDVSQTGLASGLEFELFQPLAEVKREFYAELPINIRVVGDYPEFGAFVSGLASLPRIVTVHNVRIKPRKSGGKMVMETTVKTYRYLDADEIGGKANNKKRKRRR
jgi:type IV pilus assembly protein PilO